MIPSPQNLVLCNRTLCIDMKVIKQRLKINSILRYAIFLAFYALSIRFVYVYLSSLTGPVFLASIIVASAGFAVC